MNPNVNQPAPAAYRQILKATQSAGFTMASEILTCSLLRTLAASKPAGQFLELGTGTGLATAWILDGMDAHASLVSIDKDQNFLRIAMDVLGSDNRLTLELADGEKWITQNKEKRFDYIFADTWHGKYLLLDEVLAMLNRGGLYIIDDMLPQPNWPEGHEAKRDNLVAALEARNDLLVTKLGWASGLLVAVKR
ncbi:MAG: class I SAM-dependent methyltransferase [Williamsia sp.]|nr:class I SAM-dependent methyltransferase [Williamsia sp.]